MQIERSAGILLHPTSLPGEFGIGDLGDEAYEFVNFLEKCGFKLWQTLAIGPTGYADSPYSALSAFAGNPMVISPKKLVQDGDLNWEDINNPPPFPRADIDFGWVIPYKTELLRKAAKNFIDNGSKSRNKLFNQFLDDNAYWLEDYALFMALKVNHDLNMWNTWEKEIIHREPNALKQQREQLSDEIFYHKYAQWQFFSQWRQLKEYANSKGIKIIGDIPIFVAEDSADVWANQDLFYLDEDGKPIYVAGVPPDYFSETGQRWGNPLYRWDKMKDADFSWWTDRVKHLFTLVDILRIDHFRGFEAYWEIPADEPTAVNGQWVSAPGVELFQTLESRLGKLPIIAEDLGVITDEVTALRKQFNFPGMKVLQFAFEGAKDFLPHNIEEDYIVYSGTHDNDTCLGWYDSVAEKAKSYFRSYFANNGNDVSWDFMRMAFISRAKMAVIPMQDILSLGTEARMNVPGTTNDNWTWRFWEGATSDSLADRIKKLVEIYERTETQK